MKYEFSLQRKDGGRVDFHVYPGGNALPGLTVTLMSEQEALDAGEDEEDMMACSDAVLFDLYESSMEDDVEHGNIDADFVMKIIGVRGVKNEEGTTSLWA